MASLIMAKIKKNHESGLITKQRNWLRKMTHGTDHMIRENWVMELNLINPAFDLGDLGTFRGIAKGLTPDMDWGCPGTDLGADPVYDPVW